MSKSSLAANNDYCPQTLYLYGTYDGPTSACSAGSAITGTAISA